MRALKNYLPNTLNVSLLAFGTHYPLELNCMVEQKPASWAKHAIRRWKQFSNKIHQVAPNWKEHSKVTYMFEKDALSLVWSTDSSDSEANQTSSQSTKSSQPAPSSPKKKSAHRSESLSKPKKTPSIKTKSKTNNGRFYIKIKEINFLTFSPGFL